MRTAFESLINAKHTWAGLEFFDPQLRRVTRENKLDDYCCCPCHCDCRCLFFYEATTTALKSPPTLGSPARPPALRSRSLLVHSHLVTRPG